MVVGLSVLRAGCSLPRERFLVLIYVRGWVDPSAGSIRSIENYNELIGNRTCDLPGWFVLVEFKIITFRATAIGRKSEISEWFLPNLCLVLVLQKIIFLETVSIDKKQRIWTQGYHIGNLWDVTPYSSVQAHSPGIPENDTLHKVKTLARHVARMGTRDRCE
jgi:hypothetical protein